ncbi:hypothetical protein RT95_11210 [Xanthomonas campestris]|nr:hypothetical protein RT95_11210 [Xanthomonas campestris]
MEQFGIEGLLMAVMAGRGAGHFCHLLRSLSSPVAGLEALHGVGLPFGRGITSRRIADVQQPIAQTSARCASSPDSYIDASGAARRASP